MLKNSITLMLYFLLMFCWLPLIANAKVFGIKTCGSGSPSACSAGTVPSSLPPAELFFFEEDSPDVINIGTIQIDATNIDVDGLAFSSTYGLMGFELVKEPSNPEHVIGSQLISIDEQNAIGNRIGSQLSGRDIRGAMFSSSDQLWVIDSENNELLQISPGAGTIIGIPKALQFNATPFDISTVVDLAVKTDGTVTLCNLSDFYELNLVTGLLTNKVQTSGSEGFAGMVFTRDKSITYDIYGTDDIFQFDANLSNQTILFANIINQFNAGRGDLATLAIDDDLLAELAYFTATPFQNDIHIRWKTASEVDNAGFYIWRAVGESWKKGDYSQVTRLTNRLILSKGNKVGGYPYFYVDSNVDSGITYFYCLESIDLKGKSTFQWEFIDEATVK